MNRLSRPGKAQQGFTYIWLLMALSLMGLGLGHTLEIYHRDLQREKEQQLQYVLHQYRLALVSYYNTSPGLVKRHPKRLEELLLDNRMLNTKRHIRRLYKDPLKENAEWGLVRNRNSEIVDLYSQSANPHQP